MKLQELFDSPGRGVMATSDAKGVVNTAVYSRPHFVDDDTLAWGMTEGRTYRNIIQNPYASYLFMELRGYKGVRLGLRLKEIKDAGEMLDEIREHTADIVSPAAGESVRHLACFTIVEIRALV